jgi:Cysteine-rich CPXCG
MLLDPSESHATLVEDCEVCCRPIHLSYTAEEGEILSFDALRAQ